MKIKKFAVIAACSCLVFSSNAVSAHCHNGNCHYDYDYGYNYDYDYGYNYDYDYGYNYDYDYGYNYNYDYDYGYNYDYGHHAGHNTCINNDYDCSSHPDHAHIDGVCPYYCTDQEYQYYQASTVKKVQAKLNKAGYKWGSANGVYNAKTKKSIKKFQKNKKMAVNGKITKSLLDKLDL